MIKSVNLNNKIRLIAMNRILVLFFLIISPFVYGDDFVNKMPVGKIKISGLSSSTITDESDDKIEFTVGYDVYGMSGNLRSNEPNFLSVGNNSCAVTSSDSSEDGYYGVFSLKSNNLTDLDAIYFLLLSAKGNDRKIDVNFEIETSSPYRCLVNSIVEMGLYYNDSVYYKD